MGNKLTISEIFYSIQGESSYAGLPCIFIRLSGCNLRCNYCDADYTWKAGEALEIETILGAIEKYSCDLVEVTGGEPLYQENCPDLLSSLIDLGKTVLLESNGSISIEQVPTNIISILDVKCPDSGSKNSFHPDNIELIKNRINDTPNSCELKFVLSSKDDYLYAKEFIHKNDFLNRLPILFSPVQKELTAQTLAEWLMEDDLNVRLQIQLHTILWPDISRGV
ncbi:MAG TPA: radical SAM protein [Desulfobacterales bacterium]|nr:radical SAM protein [Desulfobacterales bacterium]